MVVFHVVKLTTSKFLEKVGFLCGRRSGFVVDGRNLFGFFISFGIDVEVIKMGIDFFNDTSCDLKSILRFWELSLENSGILNPG